MKAMMIGVCLIAILAVARAEEAVAAEGEPAPKKPAKKRSKETADMPKVEGEGSSLEIPELEDMTAFREWLLSITEEERDSMFKDAEAGPMPDGIYTGFMLSDRPNFEDFDITITKKAIMTFVFDRWVGKTFDGKGNLKNILRDEAGFEEKDLVGTLELDTGYVDEKKSWIALYGEDTAYDFILDEFREIQPGFLFGKTFLVPAKKGDKVFFECGLVKIGDKPPKGQTAQEFLLENISEVEPGAEGEIAEGEPKVKAQAEDDEVAVADIDDEALLLPDLEAEAPEPEGELDGLMD